VRTGESAYPTRMRLLLTLLTAATAFGSEPIAGEPLRLKVLAAIFPEMEIERVDRRINSAWRLDTNPPLAFPDAFAFLPAYRVTGAAQGDRERCTAQDLVKRTSSSDREVRFRLYPWPGAWRGELLAIVQYRFIGAVPPADCPSLAELFRMKPQGQDWKIDDRFPLAADRHNHLEGVQFVHLTGEPEEELAIESDSGDASEFRSDLHILLLAHGRFQELLNVPSRLHIKGPGDQWTQTLDQARTAEKRGTEFCFEKTVWAAAHRRFLVPTVTHPCYPRGTGTKSE
jgi:hypothetical protein